MNSNLTMAQQRAIHQLKSAGCPMTASEINVPMATMQALKSMGLVTNQDRFGEPGVLGREREAIHWTLEV